MKKNYFIVLALALAVILAIAFGFKAKPANSLDEFARCLRDKNIVMYGASWCPHCQNEKNGFGDSFRFIPYVECPKNPKLCLEKSVSGYPTWLFPDGRRFEGEQGIENLSRQSGCEIKK